MKTIKAVLAKEFEINLYELPNGQFVVSYESPWESPITGQPVNDYNLASWIFDKKVEILTKEGLC